MFHPLTQLRQSRTLTLKEVAKLTGIALTTLRGIESGTSPFKTNEQTADCIEQGLGVPRGSLFRPEELSHLGRPPRTGAPVPARQTKTSLTCGKCHMEIPLAFTNCPDCS